MGIRNMRGKWQYRFKVNGQTVSVTTGLAATERNETKARQLEAAHRQAIQEGRWGHRPLKPKFFTDALKEFLPWVDMEYQSAPSSARRIRTSMTSCGVFFGKQMVSMIHPADIERYKTWRFTPKKEVIDGKTVEIAPVQPVTVKHDLDNLSLFFQWAVKTDYARANPCKEVSRPSDRGSLRQRVLTLAEEKQYFSHAKGNLGDIARLMLLQGMRPEEVMRIRKQDVDLGRGVLRIEFGKSKAARRTLKLTEEAKIILGRRMPDVPAKRSGPAYRQAMSPWIFPSRLVPGAHTVSVQGAHDRACAAAALAFVLYDLRHTFATRMVEAGIGLPALKDILGHDDIRVTMRYVHPNQEHQDEAMAVYDKLNEERRAKESIQ